MDIAAPIHDGKVYKKENKLTLPLIERNLNYDFLRFIGISCIILAHMGAPGIVFQARNFDVPLMVMLSGISFAEFSYKKYSSYWKYIYSRFTRLVVPTYLFLIFYNIVIYLGTEELPSLKNVLMQLSLIGGTDIGIWIIRIFFSMSIIAPFLYLINKKIISNKIFYIFIIIFMIVYEISFNISKLYANKEIINILNFSIFFTFSYGMIFLYGLRIVTIQHPRKPVLPP